MKYERHMNSGWGCLMDHGGEKPCIKCAQCGEFIRPEHMEQPCPGGAEERGLEDMKILNDAAMRQNLSKEE